MLRDGLEDYDYLQVLKQLAAAAASRGAAVPEDVRALLEVDPGLLSSLRSYAKEPGVLLSRREAVARAIERLAAGPASTALPHLDSRDAAGYRPSPLHKKESAEAHSLPVTR